MAYTVNRQIKDCAQGLASKLRAKRPALQKGHESARRLSTLAAGVIKHTAHVQEKNASVIHSSR